MDTRLLEACMSGDEQALRALIRQDPPILDRAVTCCEETPLHVAVLRGHLSFVKALLGLKPKLAFETDATGCVPLHLASAEGSAEIVRELLRANADLCGARDHCGRTPLHLAVMKGRLDAVRELIRVRPGSASERLDRGETVFHLAVKYCRLEALKLLVELLKGGRRQLLVATDDAGNNVLHFAVFFKQIETVRYLVSLGVKAITNAANGNGHTPLEVMEKSPRDFNSSEILEILSQVGVGRGKDAKPKYTTVVVDSPPPTTTNPPPTHVSIASRIKKRVCSLFAVLTMKNHMDWIADAHGNLMVVATVIASMSFQAGVNPPGGVWQEDNKDCIVENGCGAGTAVHMRADGFTQFYSSNTWALTAAVGVILLHFAGIPLKNKVGTWLMTIVACIMLFNILKAYVISTSLVYSTGVADSLTLQIDKTEVHVAVAWACMIMFIVVIHTIRIWYWLIYDKLTSLVRPESMLCYCGWMRVVFFLAGIVATLYGLTKLVNWYNG